MKRFAVPFLIAFALLCLAVEEALPRSNANARTPQKPAPGQGPQRNAAGIIAHRDRSKIFANLKRPLTGRPDDAAFDVIVQFGQPRSPQGGRK